MTTQQRCEAHSNEPREVTGERLISKKQLAERFGISCRSIDRYVAEGIFPPGLKLGRNGSLVRWRENVVDDWILANCPSSNGRAS